MNIKVVGLSLLSGLAVGLPALAPRAHAILVPAAGPGTGSALIVHGSYNNLGASAPLAPAVFANDGQMLTAGLGYPVIGAVNPGFRFLNTPLVANVPVGLNTFPGQVPGIVSASTTLVGVAGFGRAGLAATNYTLNTNFVPGRIGANTFGGQVDYVNVGGPLLANFGHFISGNLGVGGLGDFTAVGVRSRIDIGFGVGNAFVSTFTFFPTPIVIGYDGAGPRGDFVAADFGAVTILGPNNARVAAASIAPLLVGNGATVRFTGTVTIVGDPSSFDFAPMDMSFLDVPMDNFYGYGGSSDALTILPTPSAAGLLGLFGLSMGRRRRA
ncbi:MAG: hypothetical protein ACT4PL_07630 [Phycisphaerales bacterium]